VHHGHLRIVDDPSDGVYSVVEFDSRSAAYGYLRDQFEHRPRALAMLEVLVEDEDEEEDDEDEKWDEEEDDEDEEEESSFNTGRSQSVAQRQALSRRSDQLAVLRTVARLIEEGQLGVAEQVHRFNPPTKLDEMNEAPPPAPPPPLPRPTKTLTWIEIKVVDDATGKPVNWVRLVVKTPDGNQTYQTTNAEGLVRIEELEPGKCDISCELKNPRMEDVLGFVAMGEGGSQSSDEKEGGNGQQQKPGTLLIADIDRHHVKSGETLDGLAKQAGMTWKDLAKFNWGTDSPDEINKRLRNNVGCTKKTKDGQNFVFDDSDKPGIVFIPRKWEETGLATGGRHVVRVKRLKRFFIRLENDLGLRIPEVKYEAVLADGREISGELGIGGVDAIDDPPDGEVGVRFPDLDDIEAKSVAASARKGFDDRDPKELHRFFRYAKETVKRAIEAYDKYFNDYRGEGLKNDIEEEFAGDDEAIGMFDVYFMSLEKEEKKDDEDADPVGADFEIAPEGETA